MMAFAGEPMKFISPDKSSTLVVGKYGERDLIELKSEKTVHRLFHKDLDPIFQPKLAEAFDASLDKMGKVAPPTFTSAEWLSAEEVEIKGKSSVIINHDTGKSFTFIAVLSKAGSVKDLTVTPVLIKVQGKPPSSDPEVPPTPPKKTGPSSVERSGKSEP